MKITINYYFIILTLLFTPIAFGESIIQDRSANSVNCVKKLSFIEIELFTDAIIYIDSEISIDNKVLTDYLKLQLKNNLSDNYKPLSIDEKINLPDKKRDKLGSIQVDIHVINVDEYPVAYNVKLTILNAMHFNPHNLSFETSSMGITSTNNIETSLKNTLRDIIENLAIKYYKARGEL